MKLVKFFKELKIKNFERTRNDNTEWHCKQSTVIDATDDVLHNLVENTKVKWDFWKRLLSWADGKTSRLFYLKDYTIDLLNKAGANGSFRRDNVYFIYSDGRISHDMSNGNNRTTESMLYILKDSNKTSQGCTKALEGLRTLSYICADYNISSYKRDYRTTVVYKVTEEAKQYMIDYVERLYVELLEKEKIDQNNKDIENKTRTDIVETFFSNEKHAYFK